MGFSNRAVITHRIKYEFKTVYSYLSGMKIFDLAVNQGHLFATVEIEGANTPEKHVNARISRIVNSSQVSKVEIANPAKH